MPHYIKDSNKKCFFHLFYVKKGILLWSCSKCWSRWRLKLFSMLFLCKWIPCSNIILQSINELIIKDTLFIFINLHFRFLLLRDFLIQKHNSSFRSILAASKIFCYDSSVVVTTSSNRTIFIYCPTSFPRLIQRLGKWVSRYSRTCSSVIWMEENQPTTRHSHWLVVEWVL